MISNNYKFFFTKVFISFCFKDESSLLSWNMLRKTITSIIFLFAFINAIALGQGKKSNSEEDWFTITKEDLAGGTHNTRHAEIFGKLRTFIYGTLTASY